MKKIIVLHIIVLCICHIAVRGQTHLTNTIALIDSIHKRQPAERLYLQFDKTYYMPGDTLWYKAYLLNEKLSASLQSGLLYIELANDSNRVVKRQIITIQNGITNGDIALKPNWWPGNYTLRAYTNWMRNFGSENFFSRKIHILPSGTQHWMVNSKVTFKGRDINMSLHLCDLAMKNLGFHDIQLSILNGNDVIIKRKGMTDPYGNFPLKFSIPAKITYKNLSVLVEDMSEEGYGQQTVVPIELNRLENTDLQFMPEGGSLLAGLPAKVAFKAIGENGIGVTTIKGSIYNNNQKEVTSFQSTHNGMGAFTFTPQAGESYIAKVNFADGTTKSYTLPAVKRSGIALQIKNQPAKDSIELQVVATSDLMSDNTYYLIGQGRDKVYYGENINFHSKVALKKIAKALFPTGVIKFMLFDSMKQPVTQRMVFIDHADQLNIKVTSDKKNYVSKDSVSLKLLVTDAAGNPVKGNFSLALTDDNKIKTSVNEETIESKMLLSSDLKGNIEEPGYYFIKDNVNRAEDLDNLLLTQGWVDYNWKEILNAPEKLKYDAEAGFRVTGKVTNFFNKPVHDMEIMLDSDYPGFTLTTQTDMDGRFVFDNFPPLEKISFRIHAQREFNIDLAIDEFIPPEFAMIKNTAQPWYINPDSILVNYITNKFANETAAKAKLKPEDVADITSNKMLKTVTIRGKYLRKPPPLQLALDEEDMRNARTGSKPLTLMNLLNQNEKINHMFKLLVVDEQAYIDYKQIASIETQQDINQWLRSKTSEDITDMRVERIFVNTKLGETPTLLINIHTNGSKGADVKAGNYYYQPIPISLPHQFYSPRYTVKSVDKDKRSTIFWEPNIVTDASGKASLSFYTADLPGTYTLILEGSDMNGKVGYKNQQIRVVDR